MKVYEIMERLANCNAGANVVISKCMTPGELITHDTIDCADETTYDLSAEVNSVDNTNDTVYLYF